MKRWKRYGAALTAAWLALAPPSARAALPVDWGRVAERDLQAIHDILATSHPAMVVQRDAAPFRAWLENGWTEAKKLLPQVKDPISYFDLLTFYAGGFRDSHIGVNAVPGTPQGGRTFQWPGFSVAWTGTAYAVTDHPADKRLPPAGAQLTTCDDSPADALTRDRQGRRGVNIDLEPRRRAAAYWLLWSTEGLFLPPLKACVFRLPDGTARSYPLTYRAAEPIDISAASPTSTHARFGVERWGPDGWWIGAPDMQDEREWRRLLAAVKMHREALRHARTVVIDLRGNDGGDSGYAETLAKLLWEPELVDADRPNLGPVVYRATQMNRDTMAANLKTVETATTLSDEARTLRALVKRYDDAIAAGQASFTETAENPAPTHPAHRPINPMRGQMILLTDGTCTSACLDLMDLFQAMPNVRQAGAETGADTIFMEMTRTPLPSGYAGLHFGHKAWVDRPRGSNISYKPAPALTWTGSPADDAGERKWLAGAVGP